MDSSPPPIPPPIPPSLSEATPPPLPQPKWRWLVHLALFTAYPLVLGAMSLFTHGKADAAPALQPQLTPLALTIGINLGIFGIFFAVAWAFSRATSSDLFLQWRGGALPVFRGFLYSLGLRFAVAFLVLAVVLGLAAAKVLKEEDLQDRLRPKTEVLVDTDALLNNPVYLTINLTLVSFVMAGLREELWRAGMLSGIKALFPKLFFSTPGKLLAIGAVAVVFGLGHLPQGPAGVALTGVLGFGLGVIMVWHRSLWEAAWAHGFFDATTFAALYFILKFNGGKMPTL